MLQIYLYQYWNVAETQKKGRSAPRPCVDLIIFNYYIIDFLGPGISVQPGFYYRSVYKPLVISWLGGTAKCTYLDMTDRQEPPPLQVRQSVFRN
jgi:hypothetical protein